MNVSKEDGSFGSMDRGGGGDGGGLKTPLLDSWGQVVAVEQKHKYEGGEEKLAVGTNVVSVREENERYGNDHSAHLPLESQEGDEGTSEMGAVVILTLTAMGAGILSLPVTLYYGGWVVGLLVLVGFAGVADYSLILLVRAANITSRKTISSMALALYGKRGEVFVMGITLMLLVFAQIAMLIVIGDVLTPALQYFSSGDVYKASCDDSDVGKHCHPPLWAGTTRCDESCTLPPWWSSRLAVSVIATAIFYPLSLFDQLKALNMTSTAAVVAIIGVILALCVELGEKDIASASSLTAINGSWRGMMIPSILSCAFCCHFNVLEVRDEMRASAKHRIESVVHKTILGVVLVTYSLCAIVGYLIFGDALKDCSDILTCFDASDKIMLVCSLAIGLVNIVKMPLIMLPTRALILELLDYFASAHTDAGVVVATGGDVPKRPRFCLKSTSGRALLMLALCLTDLALALVMHDLTIGFSVIACTSGMAVCFIIPGALYDAALVSQSMIRGENPPYIAFHSPRFGPLALLSFGFVSAFVAFVGVVLFIAIG